MTECQLQNKPNAQICSTINTDQVNFNLLLQIFHIRSQLVYSTSLDKHKYSTYMHIDQAHDSISYHLYINKQVYISKYKNIKLFEKHPMKRLKTRHLMYWIKFKVVFQYNTTCTSTLENIKLKFGYQMTWELDELFKTKCQFLQEKP